MIKIEQTDSEKAAINPRGTFKKSRKDPKYFVRKVPYLSHFSGLVIFFQP